MLFPHSGDFTIPDWAVSLLYELQFWIYFELQYPAMLLMMYLGNDLIEAVPLHSESIPQPGYVGQFKRDIKEKYAELIRMSTVSPEFLVAPINTHTHRG